MSPAELEQKYLPYIRRVGALRLLPGDEAIRLLQECERVRVRLLGVEAFRIFENGGVQPAMEFSNISHGTVERNKGEVKFKPELRLRTPWNTDPAALQKTQALIAAGAAEGYPWYEVSLDDPDAGDLLFFGEGA